MIKVGDRVRTVSDLTGSREAFSRCYVGVVYATPNSTGKVRHIETSQYDGRQIALVMWDEETPSCDTETYIEVEYLVEEETV